MKKILFLINCFLLIINVNAMTCIYETENVKYSLEVSIDVNAPWVKGYKFGGYDIAKITNEKNGLSAGDVFAPSITDINLYKGLTGTPTEEGVCPTLLSLGNNKFTVIPYSVYNKYFAPLKTLDCLECNGDRVKAISLDGLERLYTFDDVCKYFKTDLSFVYEVTPFLSYLYFNPDYSGLVLDCARGGMDHGYVLQDFFANYYDEIIPGNVNTNDKISTCPSIGSEYEIDKILSCLSEKDNIVKQAIIDFSEKCTEREKRAIQLYSGGSIATFYNKQNVSGYLNNEIKMMFNSFSAECGSAADNLYIAINNSNRVLNAYGAQPEVEYTLAFLSLQSNYLKSLGLLTSMNHGVDKEENACNLINNDLKNIIKEIFNGIRIGAVCLVIFLSIIDVYKVVIAGDDSAKKKMPSMVSKRVIAVVIFLILPTIVLGIIDFLNKYIPVDNANCIIDSIK